MSRDFYPVDLNMLSTCSDESGRLSATNGERTPRSTFSARFENSAFGSGSSVLSSFEPPTDAEMLEKTRLAQLLDDNGTFPGSLDELQATIARLQAIYYYRQTGLETLANEALLNQGLQSGNFGLETGMLSSNAVAAPGIAVPQSVGVMGDPMWRADDDQLSIAARAVEAAAKEMAAVNQQPSQIQLQKEYLSRTMNNQNPESVGRGYRRKSRRQHSCPVALCAPQWADASWNPRSSIKTNNQSARHGTGVFLPQLSNTNKAEKCFPDDRHN